MMQSITIRRAVREDCPTLLALVRDLATFEKAPHEVTVTLEDGKKFTIKADGNNEKRKIHVPNPAQI